MTATRGHGAQVVPAAASVRARRQQEWEVIERLGKRYRATCAASVLGFVVLAGACGSSSSGTSATTKPASTPSTAASTTGTSAPGVSTPATADHAPGTSCDLRPAQVNSATGRNLPPNPATQFETTGCNWVDRTTGSFLEVDLNQDPPSTPLPKGAPAFAGIGLFTTYYDAAHNPNLVGQCFQHTCQFVASVITSRNVNAMVSVYLSPPAANPKSVAQALLQAIVANTAP